MVRSLTRGRLPKPLALFVSAVLALFWVAVAPVGIANAAVVGGFGIDGNQDTESAIDWETLPEGEVDVVRDEVGNADRETIFDSGDQEDQGPAAWDVGTTPPSGKSDIGNVLVYDREDASGDTWAYFAWDRDNGTGTGRYYIELNQLANSDTLIPNRSVGDVRITIGINGSDILECQRVETWDGDSWSDPQDCAEVVEIAVNTGSITDYFDSPNADDDGTLDANKFIEAAINLSDFGLTTCPVTGFSTINLRSQEGNENGENGKLKDLATGPIDIDSDCSAIEITKTVSGDGSGEGAVFVIEPDPTPGSEEPFLVVTAGEGGSVLVSPAFPGEYTVTELAPPAGYLLPADSSQTVQAEPRGTAEVTFHDVLGDVTFTKGYEGDAPEQGASFQLTRTHEWAYDTDPADGVSAPALVAVADGRAVDVTDNGSGDGNDTIGVIAVDGLQGGTWCITETAAPAGWVPGDPDAEICFDLGPTDASEQASVALNTDGAATFDNLLRPIAVRVEKTGSVPGIDGSFPLEGATFSLLLDDGDGVWEPEQDTTDAGSLLTDENGHATWTGLNWQERYWLLETAAPAGYEVGLNPNPALVEFTAPTTDDVVVTVQVDNPRHEFDVQLTKVDEVDQSLLEGGEFQLWRETNGVEGLQLDGDLNVNGIKSLVNGTLTFSAADHHIPWGYTYYLYELTPPTGYGYMTPNPIEIDGTSPDIAGTTVYLDAEDPRLPTGLRLFKQDDFGAPVEGATFQLYLSDGDAAFEPCDEPGCSGDVIVGGEVTSGEDGVVEWPTGLTGGLSYWVYEVSAPAGYDLMDPRQVLVEIPESAAGGVHDVTDSLELVDPRVRGGFTITKVTEGLPEGEEPVFTVQVDCGPYYSDEVSLMAPSYKAAVTDVPVGEQCTVTEPTVPDGWARVSIDNSTVTVVEDAEEQVNVTVTNERLYDSFDFVKEIEGTQIEGESASFTVFVDCASADPDADNYDQNVVLSTPGLTRSTGDIPVGLECTFTETDWDADRYAPVDIDPSSATVGDDAVGTIVVTNERLQGTLVVAKTVQNPVDGEADTFPITVDCSNGYSETFDLADGETASIDPQPVGVTCTVTEGDIDTARYVEVSDAEQEGTVQRDGDPETVTVVNQRLYGGFDLRKEVDVNLPGDDSVFEITVTCFDPTEAGGEPVVRVLELAGDETVTVSDVPTGYRCSAEETGYDADEWTLVGITPSEITVPTPSAQLTMTVTNERRLGGFPIVKEFEEPLGLPTGETPEFTVTVDCVVSGAEFPGVDPENLGAYQRVLSLNAGNDYRTAVSGIPTGMVCAVAETDLGPADQWAPVSVTPSQITVDGESAQGAGVTVLNERLTGGLTVVKEMNGLPTGETPTFTVEVDCLNGVGGTSSESADLTAGNGWKATFDGIPVGWTCTVEETELDLTRWAFDGVTYPGDADEVTIAAGDPAKVVVTVENTRLTGGFEIVKDFDEPLGLPQAENPEFVVNVVCEGDYADFMGLKLNRDNEFSVTVDGIPTEVTCTVGEEALAGWTNVSISPNPVTVEAGDTPETVTVTVLNKRVEGGLLIEKVAEGILDTDEVTFTVQLDCDGTQYDREVELGTANGFSKVVAPLPAGIECEVSEESVPEGWRLVGITYPDGGEAVVVGAGEPFAKVVVTNERLQGELTVLKTDEADTPLEGAEFTLWQSTDAVLDDTDVEVGVFTTGADGRATATGLDWGFFYIWEETKAPADYNLPTDTVGVAIELTAENVDSEALPLTTFVDLKTEIVTTPFVGDEPVSVENIGQNVARVDENDVVRDRAVISNLSEPASGTVTFELFGPYYVTTLNGMSFEEPNCSTDAVWVSEGNAITRIGEGTYEAFSEELAVADEGLEPGLYQWVAEFVPSDEDTKNLGVRGLCPDPTEMFVVRGGDIPGLDKDSVPPSESLVQPGQEITYTIMVSNSGDMPIPADEAIVVDILDPWLAFGETTMAPEGTVETVTLDEATGATTITWEIGELGAGKAVAIEYTAVVAGDVPQNEALDNVARFLELEDSTVHVVPNGALTIVKAVDPESGTGVIPGETLTYTMAVTATGELNQTDVLVSDYVPGYDPDNPESLRTTYVVGSADCDDLGECEVVQPGGDGEIVWFLGDMEAGSARTVTFQVTVDQFVVDGEGTVDVGDVINGAWVSSNETDWTPSNEVVNPVAVVLGVKIPSEPKKEPVKVLGTKLPRTGSPIGAAAWFAGALLVLGVGLRASGSRKGAQHRA